MSLLGDNRGALAFYERSVRRYAEAGDERWTARPLFGMGVALSHLGDHSRALHYYRRALAVSEAHDDKMGVAGALVQIGQIFREQGDYAQALAHETTSLRLTQEMNLAPGIMNISSQVGQTYQRMGDPARAEEAFERALALARQIGSRQHEAQVLQDMGNLALEKGDVARALELQRASLDVGEGLDEPSLVASGLTSLAEALLRARRTDEALHSAERASRLASESESLASYWQARWLVARIHRARRETDRARAALDEAIDAIEQLRRRAAGGEVERGVFFENLVAPYYDAADLAEAAGEIEAALSYAERAKARILLDCLRNGRPDLDESLTSEERATLEALRGSLRDLNRRIHADAAGPKTDPALELERRKVRQEYAAFEAHIYAARPELRLQQGELAVVPAEEMTELLPDAETAIVEFAVLDERVLAFVITRGASARSLEITVHSLDVARDRLRERVRGFAAALAGRRLDFKGAARALCDSLLQPIEARIRGGSRLVIVPDDVLWELPFQALKPGPGTYLIERHALSYAPSLSALREMARASAVRPAVRTFLGVGNPALPGRAAERRPGLHRSVPLSALPEAEREIRTLGRMYGRERSKLLTGAAAREAVVKRELPKHDVVHLATHGVFDDMSPLYSQIVLAQSEGDAEEDGLLEAWEIMPMRLQAGLVVLSACQTARGRIGRGEGVIGMSWALLVAGVPTTVVSHWNVDSNSTADLMVAFHRTLRKGPSAGRDRPSKAEALQAAQRELLRTSAYAHPFYWAGFSVVGAPF
jgi:CHAT domain-containing protein/tetratricopeptide (TPR) repeat protein